jgi:hypothetical protein
MADNNVQQILNSLIMKKVVGSPILEGPLSYIIDTVGNISYSPVSVDNCGNMNVPGTLTIGGAPYVPGIPAQTEFVFADMIVVSSTITITTPLTTYPFSTWTAPRTGIYMIQFSTVYFVGTVSGGSLDGWQYNLYKGAGDANLIAIANLTHQIGLNSRVYNNFTNTSIYVVLEAGQSYRAEIIAYNISGSYATVSEWQGLMYVVALC